MIRYVSTRGGDGPHGFETVLLTGTARDGGLFVPDRLPAWAPADFAALAGLDYAETAARMIAPFVADTFDAEELRALCREAYAGFDHAAVAPLVQLDADTFLLELFHGPTLAFKDFALQLLGRMFERVLERREGRLAVVGATSGDTGAAAIHALAGRRRITVAILHPHGRVSPVQRRQMTTVEAPNVLNIAVRGSFDDCQRLVKALFADRALADELHLAAVNSINWARIVAQTVYYAWAAVRLGAPARPPLFAVPTGNFGDVYAGHVARRMGLPVRTLVIATNENDILARFLATGHYRPRRPVATDSPAMDIQVASNFERLLFELADGDGARVAGWMAELAERGAFRVPPAVLARARALFRADRADREETRTTIAHIFRESGVMVDPHTAVGIAVGRRLRAAGEGPLVCLATAHPAKFPDAVAAALGERPVLPPAWRDLVRREERFLVLDPDLEAVRAAVRRHAREQQR